MFFVKVVQKGDSFIYIYQLLKKKPQKSIPF